MASKGQGPPLKVLIVDDSRVCAMVLSGKLRMFRCCEITIAKNGKEAVDMFLDGKKFDIIFSDKDMPIMSGPKAVEKIRAMGETNVKIVGVSDDDYAMEALMNAGADVFVPKPINIETLRTLIQEVLANKKNNTIV